MTHFETVIHTGVVKYRGVVIHSGSQRHCVLCSIQGIATEIHTCLEGGAGREVPGRGKMCVEKCDLYFFLCIFFTRLMVI